MRLVERTATEQCSTARFNDEGGRVVHLVARDQFRIEIDAQAGACRDADIAILERQALDCEVVVDRSAGNAVLKERRFIQNGGYVERGGLRDAALPRVEDTGTPVRACKFVDPDGLAEATTPA